MARMFSLFALLSIGILGLSGQARAEKPNVVILFTDDHGTLDATCYGSNDLMTPNIDRLAEEGMRFTQAYAHKVCCPSRAALLTGRHPQRAGISNWAQGDRNGVSSASENMHTEEVTIAEVLKAEGYRTALFGKWHLGAKVGHGPLDQGFDRFFGHLGGFIDNYRHYFLHGQGFHDLWDDHEEIFRRDEYYPDMMVGKAVQYIEANWDSPFFMYVAFNLPHYPEQPIDKFSSAYTDMPMPRQSYARVISSVDDHIGRILNKLDEKGIADNTIVIMMGDNGHSAEDIKQGISVDNHASGYPKGYYYSAHGGGGNTGKWIGHKGTFLEGGIRVPAIVRYPNVLPSGVVRDQVVTVMDWFPTIVELADIPKPDVAFDGRSMLPVIRDPQAASAHQVLHFEWPDAWAVREGDWKLIGFRDKKLDTIARYELLNLADAEPEVNNHAEEHPQIVERLTTLHNAWAQDVSQ